MKETNVFSHLAFTSEGLIDQKNFNIPIYNPKKWERAKKIFNIIADRVENVSP